MIRKLTLISLLIIEMCFATQALANVAQAVAFNDEAALVLQQEEGAVEVADSEDPAEDNVVVARMVELGQVTAGMEGGVLELSDTCRTVTERVCNPYGVCHTRRTRVCD